MLARAIAHTQRHQTHEDGGLLWVRQDWSEICKRTEIHSARGMLQYIEGTVGTVRDAV